MNKFTVKNVKPDWLCVGNKDRSVRQVIWIQNGQAVYRAFRLPGGEYDGMSSCSVEYLADWAERKISIAEFDRLNFNEADRREKEERQKVVNPGLKWATLEEFMEEYRRRELDRLDDQ